MLYRNVFWLDIWLEVLGSNMLPVEFANTFTYSFVAALVFTAFNLTHTEHAFFQFSLLWPSFFVERQLFSSHYLAWSIQLGCLYKVHYMCQTDAICINVSGAFCWLMDNFFSNLSLIVVLAIQLFQENKACGECVTYCYYILQQKCLICWWRFII